MLDILCRLFGAVENNANKVSMSCPSDFGPDKKLTDEQGNTIMGRYILTNPDLLRFDKGLQSIMEGKKCVSEAIHKGF